MPWMKAYPSDKVQNLVDELDRTYPNVNMTFAALNRSIQTSSSFDDLSLKLAKEYHKVDMQNAFLDIVTRNLA